MLLQVLPSVSSSVILRGAASIITFKFGIYHPQIPSWSLAVGPLCISVLLHLPSYCNEKSIYFCNLLLSYGIYQRFTVYSQKHLPPSCSQPSGCIIYPHCRVYHCGTFPQVALSIIIVYSSLKLQHLPPSCILPSRSSICHHLPSSLGGSIFLNPRSIRISSSVISPHLSRSSAVPRTSPEIMAHFAGVPLSRVAALCLAAAYNELRLQHKPSRSRLIDKQISRHPNPAVWVKRSHLHAGGNPSVGNVLVPTSQLEQ